MQQRNKYLLIILVFLAFSATAQKVKKSWDPALIAKANTAKDDAGLTAEEKKVVLYINLARIAPQTFAEIELKRYLDSTKLNDSYTRSIIKTLAEAKPIAPLQPSPTLDAFAKAHAIKFGKENKIGHGNYKERIKDLMPKFGYAMAENCDYGNKKASDIAMSLLIDEDIKDLSHRKNILNPVYRYIGVSIQPHKGYEWNCVMDFGGADNQ